MAIGRVVVVYYVRTAHAFIAGIKNVGNVCRHHLLTVMVPEKERI